MAKWEYLSMSVDGQGQLASYSAAKGMTVECGETLTPRSIGETFDRLGEEGWELAGIDPGTDSNAWWFKRPKSSKYEGDPQVY